MNETVTIVAVVALAVGFIGQAVVLGRVATKLLTERDHLIVRDGKELAQVQRARSQRPAPPQRPRPDLTEEDLWVLEHAATNGELPDLGPSLPEGMTVG